MQGASKEKEMLGTVLNKKTHVQQIMKSCRDIKNHPCMSGSG